MQELTPGTFQAGHTKSYHFYPTHMENSGPPRYGETYGGAQHRLTDLASGHGKFQTLWSKEIKSKLWICWEKNINTVVFLSMNF